ncbi:MAG: DNA repair protein RecN [Eggerthellaceae bacterium]|nr:DNA repair protein RecN [Eggerthellaceae bacterium]
MIDEIQVSNAALIRHASFCPCPGLTVVTGETGAGKTALLSALKLLMGTRASADAVRDGESALTVSGRFFGLKRLPESEFDDSSEDEELVVTRRVSSDGRSRATIDGQMASMHELAAIVAPSIDLCGQLEHQQLMRPASHVTLLDAWADDVKPALEAYRNALDAAASAHAELARVEEAAELSAAKLDEARSTLRRIDEISPSEGEYEQLKHDLELAEHAEVLARATAGTHEALAGDSGALDAIGTATSLLESVSSVDSELADLAKSLREATYVIEDVSASARDYLNKVDFDPETLAQQQERVSAIQGLLRLYGPRMEDVLRRRDEAADTVSLVDDADHRLDSARNALEEAERSLKIAADKLDGARATAAPLFAATVTSVMSHLEMAGCELICEQTRLDRASWTKQGPSTVEFLYRPGTNMQPRPLAKIASGGEISRVMLAIKVALGAHDDVDTLVFDEVDSGVGGATAVALADVIADLSKTHQVIVVTHLAQVAVRGDAHYIVEKTPGDNGPETVLSQVSGEDRVAEIARMLSGSSTKASLEHAQEMLTEAQGAQRQ